MLGVPNLWSTLAATALILNMAVGTPLAYAAVDPLTSKRAAFIKATGDLAAAQAKLKRSDAERDAATLAFDESVKANAPDLVTRALFARQRQEVAEHDESQVQAERLRVAHARRALMDAVLQPPLDHTAAEKAPTTIELIENAAKTQAKVEKLEADAATAFNVTDKANAIALAMAVKRLKSGTGGTDDELKALANARAGHEAASNVHGAWRRGEGAQRLGNRIVASGADLAKCRLEEGAGCHAKRPRVGSCRHSSISALRRLRQISPRPSWLISRFKLRKRGIQHRSSRTRWTSFS